MITNLPKLLKILMVLLLLLGSLGFSSTFAQSPPPQETLEGVVKTIYSEESINQFGMDRLVQKVSVYITKGSKKNQTIRIDTANTPTANTPEYKEGDRVIVLYTKGPQGHNIYYISDYVRRTPLLILTAIFLLLTIFVGRIRGIFSIVGMAASFLIIFLFIIPEILKGSDPVFIAILGSVFIIPITFYLSHGINRKSTVAVVSTLISLIITGLLAQFFITFTKLTGFAQEEAAFVQALNPGYFNMQGLLLAGIIIGVSGILDDTTISQSSLIEKLHQTNNSLSFKDLFKKGMDVGRDHIASLVNTLILVYAGASLPLMILFVNNPHPFSEVVNYEIIASEIVRTLVGSIGLIASVPITTLLASWAVKRHLQPKH